MDRWRGRVALVTGAGSGIGRAIAVHLLNQGLNVVACAKRVIKLESIPFDLITSEMTGELMVVKCDMRIEEEILAMFEKIKNSKYCGVDVCVNSAGKGFIGKLWEAETNEWRNILDVNVLGLSICTREALRSMHKRGIDDGHIINIASILSHSVRPHVGMYCASKHAVRALTEALRQELCQEGSGIRVTEISPGIVDGEVSRPVKGPQTFQDEEIVESKPRMEPEVIASAVEYALSAPRNVQVHDILIYPIVIRGSSDSSECESIASVIH